MIDKTQLLGMMICPACQAKLLSLGQCDSCHALFTESDDTPAIFQTSVSRTVAFEFSPDRAVVGDGFRKSFHYPARCGASLGDSPYHLDLKARQRRPGYRYDSRRKVLVKLHGVSGEILSDLLWLVGRGSLAIRRALGLGGRAGLRHQPRSAANDLLLGDWCALVSGQLRRPHGARRTW